VSERDVHALQHADLRHHESRYQCRKSTVSYCGACEPASRVVCGAELATPQGTLSTSVSSVARANTRERVAVRLSIEIAVAAIGSALIVSAIRANQQWLDRHFLPSWFLPRQWYVLIESFVRLSIAVFGASLLFMRRRIARGLSSAPDRVVLGVVAIVLALGGGDLVVRRVHVRAAEWLAPEQEPRRRPDPLLGWTFVPGRTARKTVGERTLDYAFDAAGYRVRRVEEAVDPQQPTILFVGESVMFGEGLTWEESIPAQVGKMLRLQSANLAVHGFGSDQAYLRLEKELPHFRRPVAIVSIFMTDLFGRNLDHDRPHLGPGLVWHPPVPRDRLMSLAKLLVPYRKDETVERGIATTRDVLRATMQLARARGATPLTVVPHFGPETRPDQELRRRIFEGLDVPYVLVQVDSAWRLPWDRHPNAYAAHVIATRIAARLAKR
jgi:hypothetical protein